MIVAGIPIADRDSASTRIRYYAFLGSLPKGWTWSKYKSFKDSSYDILYIQKVVDDDALEALHFAKAAGKPVVFDVDDIRKDGFGPNQMIMINSATCTTTDTEERAEAIRQYTGKRVWVVSDCIDHADNTLMYNSSKHDVPIKKCVTFGNTASMVGTVPYMKNLKKAGYKCGYICNVNIAGMPGKRIEWNRHTFVSELLEWDVAVVAHRDHDISAQKSNNRLLVCFSVGMPIICSNTKAYVDTMTAVFHPECVIAGSSNTAKTIDNISELRKNISVDCMEYAWDNYAPAISGRKLAEVFTWAMTK